MAFAFSFGFLAKKWLQQARQTHFRYRRRAPLPG
jgi:hypothetical protein